MKQIKNVSSLIFLLSFLIGCNSSQNGNPTPRDFLQTKDADIFMLEGTVFSNANDVNWVKELEYTLGDQIGEITKQSNSSIGFENGTASKLPIGTKIYKTDTAVYIAIVNGEEIPYLKMLEG